MIEERLGRGAQMGSINVPVRSAAGVGGWLPNDELTREWLELVREYREECDAL